MPDKPRALAASLARKETVPSQNKQGRVIDYTSPDVELLRTLLNGRPQDQGSFRDPLDAVGNPDLPSVPHPSGFRPDPLVNGNPYLANAVHDMFKVAPELRGRVDLISTAPTTSRIQDLDDSELSVLAANRTNTIGTTTPKQTNIPNNEIWLRNDGTYPQNESLEKTLSHELAHVGGKRGHGFLIPRDNAMDIIEMLGAKILGGKVTPMRKGFWDTPLDEMIAEANRKYSGGMINKP